MRHGAWGIFSLLLLILISCKPGPIDRYAVVSRHNVVNTGFDSLGSLSVGNGRFCFTADLTGLQTFPEMYEKGIPLGTMSDWGWVTDPNPENYSIDDVYKTWNVHGRSVDYVHQFRENDDARKYAASNWLRENPRKIPLGLIGLLITGDSGKEISAADIKEPRQKLDLWTGEIESIFSLSGDSVKVLTVCHPEYDLISVKIKSALISKNRLGIKIRFPFGAPLSFGSDINAKGEHTTEILSDTNNTIVLEHRQNNNSYKVLLWKNNSIIQRTGDNSFILDPEDSEDEFSFSCQFLKDGEGRMQTFGETETASKRAWDEFWSGGGAVDFSSCDDPRAMELERRVVLSRYLTRIQCAGDLPPAETGLTFNSWYGKFHLEMHWWHSVHFAMWQKNEILERQLKYYSDILANARKTAVHQGYKGVRWPKMTGPEGIESPSAVGTYLIWQQPHAIFFAELLYANAAESDKPKILEKYKDLVFATADFMASYAWHDTVSNRYCLGPVLIPAQESLSAGSTINPSFELAYWKWGLRTACEWQRRAGQAVDESWDSVAQNISALPVQGGLYLCSEDTKDSYINPRYMSDHPIAAGVLGVVPETGMVDRKILRNTLDTIAAVWNWKSTWGWDFPMLAMSAAASGNGEKAIDFLLMDAPKNRYLANGHNYQDRRLPIYLPGNGGLLTAIAKMCTENGFPHNGKWNVRWENLNRYPE